MPPGTSGVNGAKAPRESSESGVDSLPDGILQHIIGFLPARDAVRTCVLAQRWRDLWMLATRLRITAATDDDMEELREFVDHLFLLRGIAPLETCEMRFHSIVDADTFSSYDVVRVNLWFQHAVRCQIRVLRFAMTGKFAYCELIATRLVSQYLMELELVGMVVKQSFLNLSGCPALELLLLDESDLRCVKKISSESLKRLSISCCFFNKSFRTHIVAPCLVSLQIDGNVNKTPVLESMPSLVNASVRIVRIDGVDVDSCNNCDSGDCDSCHSIIHGNSSCVLLEGLSKAKNLALVTESKTGSDPKMVVKGSHIPGQKTGAISKYLEIVEVKCDVVDDKVYKVSVSSRRESKGMPLDILPLN
ncbi:hypothetical protein U9M48_044331 [Paspalum notatum var. saurae]|uniref:F-box domain-containing protein n=1 Tax=Paspalum notatum var. saurae TaxID=547442 RepID=A0AAQ3XGK7_PASNO